MNSILLCRLCLVGNYNNFDIFSEKLIQLNVKEKMEKYLNLEVRKIVNILHGITLNTISNSNYTFLVQRNR